MAEQTINFELPEELEAHEPPEMRGLRRDDVRLLVLPRFEGAAVHARFRELGKFLRPGDLLVLNTSRTLPAMLVARDQHGAAVEVRLATRRAEDRWDALLLRDRNEVGRLGMRLDFGQDMTAQVVGQSADHSFLWQVQFDRCCAELLDLIYRVGSPIRYAYAAEALPLDLYQTVYAAEPGSVEMPSAGRAFTWQLLLSLQRAGVRVVGLTLHTGLSSTRDEALDALHPNYEEEYSIPVETAREVAECHRRDGRVIAVGTTVVRALETAALPPLGRLRPRPGQAGWRSSVRSGRGKTKLHIDLAHQLCVVDALLTGLHEPQSSHLDLLSAFVSPDRLRPAYLEAVEHGYLWHEFGDMNLII